MRLHVVALDGVFDTGLSTVLDAFGTANELAEMTGVTSLRFQVTIAGVRRAPRTSQGLRVPVENAADLAAPDWAIVPAIGHKMPGPLAAALASREVRDVGELLRHWASRGANTAAACIGTFVVAESSLLDGEDATTTWWLAPMFRKRYPRVRLDESRIVVPSHRVLTAGAALSHLDLALSLIRQASPELAALTTRYLVVDARTSQAIYAVPHQLAHADPLVGRFERWARESLGQGFALEGAARALGTSKRTLARRMHDVLGKTPLEYFQELRVERAVHLLKTTGASIDQIAAQVGYADGVSLRALLRRRLKCGVRELRGRA